MKRGSFWMTTVATGLMVAGLMTVSRAGLKSQGFLFLAGQMKIASGDTNSGMKLLARAANGPDLNSNSMLASEKPSPVVEKPCQKLNTTPAVRKVEKNVTQEAAHAPEPTLASLTLPAVPAPPVTSDAYSFHTVFLPREQQEMIEAQRADIERVQKIREAKTRKMLHQIELKYGRDGAADAARINAEVQKALSTWSQ